MPTWTFNTYDPVERNEFPEIKPTTMESSYTHLWLETSLGLLVVTIHTKTKNGRTKYRSKTSLATNRPVFSSWCGTPAAAIKKSSYIAHVCLAHEISKIQKYMVDVKNLLRND